MNQIQDLNLQNPEQVILVNIITVQIIITEFDELISSFIHSGNRELWTRHNYIKIQGSLNENHLDCLTLNIYSNAQLQEPIIKSLVRWIIIVG